MKHISSSDGFPLKPSGENNTCFFFRQMEALGDICISTDVGHGPLDDYTYATFLCAEVADTTSKIIIKTSSSMFQHIQYCIHVIEACSLIT